MDDDGLDGSAAAGQSLSAAGNDWWAFLTMVLPVVLATLALIATREAARVWAERRAVKKAVVTPDPGQSALHQKRLRRLRHRRQR